MIRFLRGQRIILLMLLISCRAGKAGASSSHHPQITESEHSPNSCPPCELLFTRLEKTGSTGKLAHEITVQERGEPKSGTGVLYTWGAEALLRTCDYLQELYGEATCRFDDRVDQDGNHPDHEMIFEPALGSSDARCSCETIDRVSIVMSAHQKHLLPVRKSCAYYRGGGTLIGKDEAKGNAREPPCTFADGTQAKNNTDLWRCMHEANCDITDDKIQMAVFRDPRPAIVSTYYHVLAHTGLNLGDLDAFVARELPIICQWLIVRYTLFSGILAHQSMEFWYEDAMVDPLGWHYDWFVSVGLQLPVSVVESIAQAAIDDRVEIEHKNIDVHQGEQVTNETSVRRFEDEVSPHIIEFADDVLRTWLPPVLLERLGVVP